MGCPYSDRQQEEDSRHPALVLIHVKHREETTQSWPTVFPAIPHRFPPKVIGTTRQQSPRRIESSVMWDVSGFVTQMPVSMLSWTLGMTFAGPTTCQRSWCDIQHPVESPTELRRRGLRTVNGGKSSDSELNILMNPSCPALLNRSGSWFYGLGIRARLGCGRVLLTLASYMTPIPAK